MGPPLWLVMPADRAARQIVRAVARRRREAVITALGTVAVFVQRHVPGLVAMVLRRARIRGRGEPALPPPGLTQALAQLGHLGLTADQGRLGGAQRVADTDRRPRRASTVSHDGAGPGRPGLLLLEKQQPDDRRQRRLDRHSAALAHGPRFFLGLFLTFYGPVRFALDFLRIDETRYAGWTPAQYLALLAMGAGVALLVAIRPPHVETPHEGWAGEPHGARRVTEH